MLLPSGLVSGLLWHAGGNSGGPAFNADRDCCGIAFQSLKVCCSVIQMHTPCSGQA